MKVDYFYIIHRKQDTDRMENVKRIIELTPCSNYEIVDEDSKLWYPIEKCKRKNIICMWSKKVVLPIESHYWNNVNIMVDIAKRKLQNVIVYEDDTYITSDFNLEIDLSKMYVNLNTGYHIYVKGNAKDIIQYEEYVKQGKPEKYTVKYVNANAVLYPNVNDSIIEFIQLLEAYRIKKKGKFRLLDYEINRMIKLYKLEDRVSRLYKVGFEQNKAYGSTLGNVIHKWQNHIKIENTI